VVTSSLPTVFICLIPLYNPDTPPHLPLFSFFAPPAVSSLLFVPGYFDNGALDFVRFDDEVLPSVWLLSLPLFDGPQRVWFTYSPQFSPVGEFSTLVSLYQGGPVFFFIFLPGNANSHYVLAVFPVRDPVPMIFFNEQPSTLTPRTHRGIFWK